MATAAATRPSGPVLVIPNYGSASPNHVKLGAARSPGKSVSVSSPPASPAATKSRRSCMCSPTNHPGSFRCSLHKERKPVPVVHTKPACHSSPPPPSAVVSAGSGARVLARRALAPSQQSHNRRRVPAAGSFRPRPTRFSAVSFAGERAANNGH